jgi:hypothetical protein
MKWAPLLLALALVASCVTAGEARQATSPEARILWEVWPQIRVSPPDPWALKHAGLRAALAEQQVRHPGLFTVEEEGVSAEGRKIPLLRLGNGPTGVLLWSQMHGDEPTATLALLDLLNWCGTCRSDPRVQQLLSKLTLWIIPMLNPDGTERSQRWNAQEIDINRDALRLSTPEGRFLKAVRDRVQPVFGYNLHNQNPDTLTGKGGRQVAIALMSVPGDEALTETGGTKRTKQLAVKVQQLVAAIAPGRVSRYDMDYTARAFGDSMTRWGTPTLLIETGGWAGADEAGRLVRLNFVALVGSLGAIADGSVAALPSEAYARIPLNLRDALTTLVVRNTLLTGGRGLAPFKADLSFVLPGAFAGEKPRRRMPTLHEVGDLSYAHGLTELDAAGMLAVPWPTAQPAGDWPTLQQSLRDLGLAEAMEAGLLAAVRSHGEKAVARPGYAGPVLLYRASGKGRFTLAGAVLQGRLVGEPLLQSSTGPSPR